MAVSGRRPRKQKPEVKPEINLGKLIELFHSEDGCRQYLEHIRWPNGIACLRCGNPSVSRVLQRGQIDCNSCRYQFSVTAGTMLQDTHLPLWKWFLAIYTIIESKKGVSANQLKRELDVSYKTAWYLCHRIRAAISQDTDWEERVLLSGIIEMDETFVGGKTEGKGRGYKGNKALVVGVVQRDGEIVLQIATDRTRKTLHEIALKHIAPEAVAIFTNEWPAYTGMGDHDTRHETVNHSQDEFVRGDVHTNTVEGVWTHKGLVHFDDAREQHSFFSIAKLAHSSPNSVAQVPSSFVGHVKGALKLVGGNAFLRLTHHVDCYEPLVEGQLVSCSMVLEITVN